MSKTLRNSIVRNSLSSSSVLVTRVEYSPTDGSAVYVGFAVAGTSEDKSSWMIKRLNYDPSTGAMTSDAFANGLADFKFAWSDRDSYTYS